MSNTLMGWRGISTNAGKFVAAEDGFTVAARECGILVFEHTAPLAEGFKELLVEWYFSGNWIEVHNTANISDEAAAALNRMGARAHGGADNG